MNSEIGKLKENSKIWNIRKTLKRYKLINEWKINTFERYQKKKKKRRRKKKVSKIFKRKYKKFGHKNRPGNKEIKNINS